MAHIYVIAGHGAGDSGAVGNGYQEAERVRALATRIKERGGDEVSLHPFSDNAYESAAISNLMIPRDWQIIELHMDAAVEGARGAHVIISDAFDPDEYDKLLADKISSIFPGRANKIVKRGDLANPNRAKFKGYPYRLVENGFITNAEDVAIFNSNIDTIADIYLEAFGIKSNGAATAPAETPKPSPVQPQPSAPAKTENFGGTYRVNTGMNVRSQPSLSGEVVASYAPGETVVLDNWYVIADGYVWGRYTGYSGATRYIAVGPYTGKPEPDDYLVKI